MKLDKTLLPLNSTGEFDQKNDLAKKLLSGCCPKRHQFIMLGGIVQLGQAEQVLWTQSGGAKYSKTQFSQKYLSALTEFNRVWDVGRDCVEEED